MNINKIKQTKLNWDEKDIPSSLNALIMFIFLFLAKIYKFIIMVIRYSNYNDNKFRI